MWTNDDLIRLLKTMSKDEILKNIQTNIDRNISDKIHQEQSYPILEHPTIASNWHMYNYDNMDAATYADTNYNQAGPIPSTIREMTGWDPSWPTNYKVYTSDCTNFISQAVFEGVAFTASDPNYFYPNSNNYSNWWYYKFSTIADGSSPWVNVGEFYNFLTANYFNYITWGVGIRGPAGYGVDLCNIQVGDIIFLQSLGVWQHTVIVDQIGSNPCNTNDVYVAAHSDNYKRRPLSEYSGYLMYPVEIKGYLDEYHLTFLSLVSNSWEATGFEALSLYPAPEDPYYPTDPTPKLYPEP